MQYRTINQFASVQFQVAGSFNEQFTKALYSLLYASIIIYRMTCK
jgi:hypothetical protein